MSIKPVRVLKHLTIVVLICLIYTGVIYAQRLESTVTLTLERLPLEKQEKLQDFAEVIERYINEFDWTEQEFNEPLTVSFSIQLEDASTSYEDRYSAIVMISNNSDMQYSDRYWRFPYSSEINLDHGGVYHPLSGFIDYYVYVILAGEFDKLGLFMGTPFFEKAKQVADQATFDAQFSKGWKERTEFLQRLMGDENKGFREMKDRYYLGLSYMEDDDSLVKKYCLEAIDLLDKVLDDDPDHKDATNFLKAHHLEIVEIFKDQSEVLRKMMRIDPDRADTYRKYL